MFVVDFTDDLFQHVLDGDQSGHAAVFVDHDGHVQAIAAEFLEQDIEALAFGDVLGRTQQGAEIEVFAAVEGVAQQVLDDQDADDVVLAFVDDRKAGMAGFDDFGDQALQVPVMFEHHHLRARNHHIAHLGFRHLHDAFHHLEGVGVQQFPLLGVAQQRHEFVPVLGFAHQGGA